MDTTEVMLKLTPIDPRKTRRPYSARNLMVATEVLTKSYRDFNAVDGISLQVPQGGVYGFLSPNGTGKSATTRLLLGLMEPTSGRMSVLGHPVGTGSSLPAGAIESLIEGPPYYPSLSGKENLMMLADYLELPKAQVQHALKTVNLAGQESKLIKWYSMGMKQRLGLVMALLADPRLTLPDEPTNGPDPADVAKIRQLIIALARQEGVTVIVSSHILSEIEQMVDSMSVICARGLRYQGPLSGLRDKGVIEFTATDPAGVSALLRAHRVGHRITGGVIRAPMLLDPLIRDLVTRTVQAGQTLLQVQMVCKSLEQAFLELTDPLTGREVQWRPSSAWKPTG